MAEKQRRQHKSMDWRYCAAISTLHMSIASPTLPAKPPMPTSSNGPCTTAAGERLETRLSVGTDWQRRQWDGDSRSTNGVPDARAASATEPAETTERGVAEAGGWWLVAGPASKFGRGIELTPKKTDVERS
ncbi:hypothetical protein PRNP1_012263 [Phytophthora ramorum]